MKRRLRFVTDAILGRGKEKPWTGPVVRRDPSEYRQRSVIEFWLCQNAYCRNYTPRGSAKAGMCLICFTPRHSPAEGL